jgi:hypothetical protein
MIDLGQAIVGLGKIPNVLGIRYSTRKPQDCLIPVLRDTAYLRIRIARVMARYSVRYRVLLEPRTAKHVMEVERIAEQARKAESGRKPLPAGYSKMFDHKTKGT